MEDRSKGADTVRPQVDERCEKRRESDGVLNVTNDENGDELNGETNDEDMEDGEMGFDDGSAQVRNIRDSGQPTAKEHQEHMTTHRPYRSCKLCVMGRGVNAPHKRSDAQDGFGGEPHVSMEKSMCPLCWSSGTETQDDVGHAGTEKGDRVSLHPKESSEVHRPTRALQGHAQVRQRAVTLTDRFTSFCCGIFS